MDKDKIYNKVKMCILRERRFFRLFTRMGVRRNLNLREEPNFRFSDSAYRYFYHRAKEKSVVS